MDEGITEKVLDTVCREHLLCPGDTVFLALSGGADSMSLLYALISLKERLSLREICALHLNHGLRAEESQRDEAFVRRQCARLNIPLTVCHADVAALKKRGESVEQAGRRLRYAFFERETAKVPGAKTATAHNADDQAETVLLNLLRGCGISGLCGIPYVRGRVIRPLLDCNREQIEHYCAQNGIPFITDSTNASLSYDRNKVRHLLLPVMREIRPNAARSLLRLSSLAREEEDFWEEITASALHEAEVDGGYSARSLRALMPAVRRRVLLKAARLAGARPEMAHIDRMAKLITSGGSLDLPGGVRCRCDEILRFFPSFVPHPAECLPLTVGESFCLGGYRYRVRVFPAAEWRQRQNVYRKLFSFSFSCDMIKGKLCVRSRIRGDRFHPAGRGCGKTLKKLFNEEHLPQEMRSLVPIVCDDEGILLVCGFAPDERAVVTRGTKEMITLEPLGKDDASDEL